MISVSPQASSMGMVVPTMAVPRFAPPNLSLPGSVPVTPSAPSAPAFPATPAAPTTPAAPAKSPMHIAPSTPSAPRGAANDAARGAGPVVEVWGWDPKLGRDVLLRRSGDESARGRDAIADAAYDNAAKVLGYYQSKFGRASFDGKGTVLKLRVHAPDAVTGQNPANNAYWMNDEGRIWLGDGDGVLFKALGGAVDVVGHEFTHGVIDRSIKQRAGFGQEGALHESFSDVLATGLDGNWQIGEGVYTPGTAGDAIRDLENPVYKHIKDLKPWTDESHVMADVPNHAAYKVAKAIGADAMRSVWYEALTGQMKSHAGFGEAARATIAAAAKLYGRDSSQVQAVRDAWTAVGITEKTPQEVVTAGMDKAMNLMDTARRLGALRSSH